jgi:hypothetical protein
VLSSGVRPRLAGQAAVELDAFLQPRFEHGQEELIF